MQTPAETHGTFIDQQYVKDLFPEPQYENLVQPMYTQLIAILDSSTFRVDRHKYSTFLSKYRGDERHLFESLLERVEEGIQEIPVDEVVATIRERVADARRDGKAKLSELDEGHFDILNAFLTNLCFIIECNQ